ncbi:MAG: 23S rRNA (uracil(1939)-C(5))-methyltransferase RlmD, partial [Saprospiraceae bacterium]
HTGLLRNLIIRTNSSGEVMLSLIIGSNTEDKVINLLSQIQEKFSSIKSIFVGFNQKRNDSLFEVNFKNIYGENYLIETLNHVKFYISPKSFFQTNTKQAELLYSLVEDFAQLKGTETIYDLYCGVGSIGIYLAKNAKTIIGVEEIEDAILDARKNASLNQLENTHFYTGDAKLIVNESLFEKHGEADLIIVDPPRAGLHEDLIKTLLNIAAKKIIYVSCNPATQARDLLLLCEKYHVTRTKPVDMFPHTNHVECIAALELKS